jgi:P-type Cu+ transporter
MATAREDVPVTATAHAPAPDAAPPRGAPPVELALAIGGMTCGACAARIERRLNRLDGVSARVNFATERAAVVLDGGVPVERVVGEVQAVGYSARLIAQREGAAAPDGDAGRQARSLGRRLVVAALLFMPLCDLSVAFWLVPTLRFPGWQFLLIALAAPVICWAAWPFYAGAVRSARHRTATMDTLVSIGIVASVGWSLYAMFWRDTGHAQRSLLFVLSHGNGGAIYLDVAAGVTTFLLAGRYYEAVSRRRAGTALTALAGLAAKEVGILDGDGVERRHPLSVLAVGDRFVVRSGETVAADGVVISGSSSIDRSAMTGESVPADVGPGDRVTGGTIELGGRLVVRATAVGDDTRLAGMVRLVERAQDEKAAAQRLADRIAAVFVPLVLLAAVATLSGWLLAGGSSGQAVSAALSVLIIACPCALGLATPAALVVAAGRGAQAGIFFKGYRAFESSRQVDTVVLDKTGTLTEGRMAVTDVTALDDVGADRLLSWAGALEEASEHPIGRAIAAHARREGAQLVELASFESVPGHGVTGTIAGHVLEIGSRAAVAGEGMPAEIAELGVVWEKEGKVVVAVRRDGAVIGAMALSDSLRSTAAPAVRELAALGLHCVLLSGDDEGAARAMGRSLGIDEVVAGALPADKAALVRRLQAAGRSVAMVGDGVNDGPALATADLGIAVGSGTDVAIGAAEMIVVRDDLRAVPAAIELARRTLHTIRTNLVWAFCYNVVAIPLAALGFLNPLIAAAAMAMSSGFVVWNSSRLRHWDPTAHRAVSGTGHLPEPVDADRSLGGSGIAERQARQLSAVH